MSWQAHLWLSSQARRADFSALVLFTDEGGENETWLLTRADDPRGTVVGTCFEDARSRVLAYARANEGKAKNEN